MEVTARGQLGALFWCGACLASDDSLFQAAVVKQPLVGAIVLLGKESHLTHHAIHILVDGLPQRIRKNLFFCDILLGQSLEQPAQSLVQRCGFDTRESCLLPSRHGHFLNLKHLKGIARLEILGQLFNKLAEILAVLPGADDFTTKYPRI